MDSKKEPKTSKEPKTAEADKPECTTLHSLRLNTGSENSALRANPDYCRRAEQPIYPDCHDTTEEAVPKPEWPSVLTKSLVVSNSNFGKILFISQRVYVPLTFFTIRGL